MFKIWSEFRTLKTSLDFVFRPIWTYLKIEKHFSYSRKRNDRCVILYRKLKRLNIMLWDYAFAFVFRDLSDGADTTLSPIAAQNRITHGEHMQLLDLHES